MFGGEASRRLFWLDEVIGVGPYDGIHCYKAGEEELPFPRGKASGYNIE